MIEGGPEIVPAVLDFLEEQGIRTKGNLDLYMRVYKHFGVGEARELRERAVLRSLGERRVFVLATPDMNREAQNALLKTLEEPAGNALFIFIVPSPQTLLPTLRSRMQGLSLLSNLRNLASSKIVSVEKFLSAVPQKRLDMLKHLLEKGEDEKRDLGAILSFLSELETKLVKHPNGLHAIYRARKYVADRGALMKPLLEQVALLVPRV